MKERGYIALARGALDHPLVGASKPFSRFEAWVWLLEQAAFKPKRVRVSNGHSQLTATLQRGQLCHSLRYMAAVWGWSVKSVRTFLTRLETDTQIGTQKGTAQTLITICNYDLYQSAASYKETQKGTQPGTQGARKGHKEEELNKETKDIAPDLEAAFVAWYAIYPKKKARDKARKAFFKLIASRAITLPELMAKTAAYAAHWKALPETEARFIPYPASWLNSGEYADEIPQTGLAASNGGASRLEAPTQTPETFTECDWLRRLELHNQGNRWPENYWGPAPGKPGCLVPAELLGAANV
jgi:hypothetical protein